MVTVTRDIWAKRALFLLVDGHRIAYFDCPATEGETAEPLLIVHGFPTSSFDFAQALPTLNQNRRVVLVDLLGFGLSSKPDIAYTMALQADVVEAVTQTLLLTRLALLTHDMGDTVGGELLARQSDGTWPVEVTKRIVTNGGIYIDLAHLTAGQEMLLAMPDAKAEGGPGVELMAASLAATLGPAHRSLDMTEHAELVCLDDGDALLPRLVRYIEERRNYESRFTGAIETHPSPVLILWGPEDPIAVPAMPEQFIKRRTDAQLVWLSGAGHFPMVEDPDGFAAAVLSFLSAG